MIGKIRGAGICIKEATNHTADVKHVVTWKIPET